MSWVRSDQRAVADRLDRADLRVVSLAIPPQEVITRDNVPARVNAVLMFHGLDGIGHRPAQDHR